MAMSLFPVLLPGEIPQSGLIRLGQSVHATSADALKRLILDGKANWTAQSALPPRLGILLDALPALHPQKDARTMFDEHTLLPAFTYFEGKEVRTRCEKLLHDGRSYRHVWTLSGMSRTGFLGVPRGWLYCPICAAEDQEDFGCSYFHREHQFPGTSLCWKHGSSLVFSCEDCRINEGAGHPILPRPGCKSQGHALDYAPSPPDMPIVEQLEIARAIAHMCQYPSQLSSEQWREHIREALIMKGYQTTGHLCYEKVEEVLLQRFGEGLGRWLIDFNNHTQGRTRLPWLRRSLDHRSHSKHPLIKIMLARLVADSLAEFESRVVGVSLLSLSETAWEDLWAPDWISGLRSLAAEGVSRPQIAKRLNVPERDVAFFVSRLGLRILNTDVPEALIQSTIRDLRAGITLRTAIARTKLSRDQLLQEVNQRDPVLSEELWQEWMLSERKRHRGRMTSALTLATSWGDLYPQGPTVSWLRKFDRQWLAQQTAMFPRSRRVPIRTPFMVRDSGYAAAVSQATADLRSRNNYPRITCRLLFEDAGLPAAIRKDPQQFPRTHAAILEGVETTADFGQRQLRNVIRQLAQNTRSLSVAEVRRHYQIPACLRGSAAALIRELILEQGLSVDEASCP